MQGQGYPLPRGKVIALDSETTGLRLYHGAVPFLWGFFTELGEYGIIPHDERGIAWLQALVNDSTRKLVFHNGKFDLTGMMLAGIDVLNHSAAIHDTMFLSKLLNENGDHDLRTCAVRMLGAPTEDKDEIEEWLKKANRGAKAKGLPLLNFSDAPRDIVERRCLWDVEHTLKLFYTYTKLMDAGRISKSLYQTECDLLIVTLDMENYGVLVDVTLAEELRAEALRGMKRIQGELDALVCPLTIVRERKGKRAYVEYIKSGFNPGSTAIQMPAAFNKLGIELKYKTKAKREKDGSFSGGGRWSFDENALFQYADPHLVAIMKESGEEGWAFEQYYDAITKAIKERNLPASAALIPWISKLRELSKMVSTYYDNFIESAVDIFTTPAGRRIGTLHCRFNQMEALTGRFSCSDPNLQNMPRLLGPRQCLITRRGRIHLHYDFEQVEMKFFIHFAEDPVMAEAVKRDIHRTTAARCLRVELDKVTDEQRKRAKATNFGVLYGSGAQTLADTLTSRGIPTTLMEAQMLLASLHREFPSIRRITSSLKTDLIRKGYVENPFGRRYHIPTKFGYKSLNYLCQGTSADLMKVGMVKIWRYLREHTRTGRLLITVHDELVIEMARTEVSAHYAIIQGLMEDWTSFYLPITVDSEVVTRRWSEKLDLEEAGFSNLQRLAES